MKKIFTLLFSVGAFATSFAQYNHQQNDGKIQNGKNDQYVYNNRNSDYDKRYDERRGDVYTFSEQEKNFQIAKINHDFDMKINSIQRNFLIGRRRKMDMIQDAQREKSIQIEMVYAKFSSNKNQWRIASYGKRDHDDHDNWKH